MANELMTRIQDAGVRPGELIAANEVSEIESIVHPESGFVYSTKVGIWIGVIIGLIVGILQLVFIGSEAVANWGRVAAILVSCVGGWAMYGAIMGGSGVFSRGRLPADLEHRFEESVAREKTLVAIRLDDGRQLDAIQRTLTAAGATDIHYS
jgi:hypothetical protein